MEPPTDQHNEGTRTIGAALTDLERAGAKLEQAGRKRNVAIACAVGGGFLAGGLGYLLTPDGDQLGGIVRIATAVLALVLFVQANGHEAAAGRLLKGQRQAGRPPELGLFPWLGRWR